MWLFETGISVVQAMHQESVKTCEDEEQCTEILEVSLSTLTGTSIVDLSHLTECMTFSLNLCSYRQYALLQVASSPSTPTTLKSASSRLLSRTWHYVPMLETCHACDFEFERSSFSRQHQAD